MEMAMTADLIRESLKDQKLLLKHLQFESIDFLQGHENLKKIIEAIATKRWVSFNYESFVNNTNRNYKVIPSLLKRYQSRWYLIAQTKNTHITFGIDRITNFKTLSEKFKDTDLKMPDKLESVVGLNYSGGEEQRVVIQADALQSKYLKSLPLHPSQKIIKETKDYTHFEYRVIPNLELRQALLRLGEQVKVIEPKTLIDDLKVILTKTLRQYENR